MLAELPPACLPAVGLGSSPALSNGHSNGNGRTILGHGRASAPVPEDGHTSAGRYTTIRTPTSDSGSGSESVGGPVDIDFDKWQSTGIPLPLIAACAACQNGVKRAHLVDAQMDGSLLLELYSRDGVGVMLSADFYEVGTSGLLSARRVLRLGKVGQWGSVSLSLMSTAICFIPEVSCWQAHIFAVHLAAGCQPNTLSTADSKHQPMGAAGAEHATAGDKCLACGPCPVPVTCVHPCGAMPVQPQFQFAHLCTAFTAL